MEKVVFLFTMILILSGFLVFKMNKRHKSLKTKDDIIWELQGQLASKDEEIENLRKNIPLPKITEIDLSARYEVNGNERHIIKTKNGYIIVGMSPTFGITDMGMVDTEKEVLDYMNKTGYKLKE